MIIHVAVLKCKSNIWFDAMNRDNIGLAKTNCRQSQLEPGRKEGINLYNE